MPIPEIGQDLVRSVVERIAVESGLRLGVCAFKDGMVEIEREIELNPSRESSHICSVKVKTLFQIAVGADLAKFIITLKEYVELAAKETNDTLKGIIKD